MTIASRVLIKILLMILFCWEEVGKLFNFYSQRSIIFFLYLIKLSGRIAYSSEI